jgi:predicted nucleic acid-binding protein
VILVDTSVWVDFFRSGDRLLADALIEGQVLSHPWVRGELALGRFDPHGEAAHLMAALPKAVNATDAEVLSFISAESLAGSGIGYVDAALLASARLTRDTVLWTHDKRLSVVCARMGLLYADRPEPLS